MRSSLSPVALGLAGAAILTLPTHAHGAAAPADEDPRRARVAHSVSPATAEPRAARHFRARHRTVRLAERVERRTDVELPRTYNQRLLDETPAELAERREGLRAELPDPAPATAGGDGAAAAGSAPPALQAIASCESGGSYSTDTGNGFYGAYQFTQSTWESVGGSGNPATASPGEQDRRAAQLYAREGASPWPVCGR